MLSLSSLAFPLITLISQEIKLELNLLWWGSELGYSESVDSLCPINDLKTKFMLF